MLFALNSAVCGYIIGEGGLEAGSDAESRKVLSRMGFSGSTVRATLLAQLGIIAFNYLFTCAVLMRQRPRTGCSEALINGKKFRLVKGAAAGNGGITTAEDLAAISYSLCENCTQSVDHSSRVDSSVGSSNSNKKGYTSVFGFRIPYSAPVKPIGSGLGGAGASR